MMDVLKVLVRICLIGIGLLSIAAGGLCTAVGATQGLDAWWIVSIGLVSLIGGGALIRYIFRKWKREMAEEENP
ncbi:MAG: hypothetical protein H6R14_1400 [Proteobacteria bacterium]|nr:hypothetical protein [Pseudomonadota bacterium]